MWSKPFLAAGVEVGTAAGDVAFPKGMEHLASVLKRYKRRLSSNKPHAGSLLLLKCWVFSCVAFVYKLFGSRRAVFCIDVLQGYCC
jgi:hypothetical protein